MSHESPVDAWHKLSAVNQLRHCVELLNNASEMFLDRFTVPQLFALWLGYRRSGWDLTPDEWSRDYLRLVLNGEPPPPVEVDPRSYRRQRRASTANLRSRRPKHAWRLTAKGEG